MYIYVQVNEVRNEQQRVVQLVGAQIAGLEARLMERLSKALEGERKGGESRAEVPVTWNPMLKRPDRPPPMPTPPVAA